MQKRANTNLYLHLKWLFLECVQTVFFTTSRAEHYSAYKIKVLHSQYQRTSDFTMMSTRNCSSYYGHCRPISAILRTLDDCSVLVARKLLQSVTNEPDEHLNIDKFVLNVPAVAVVVIGARF